MSITLHLLYISLIDPIFNFSLKPESGGNPFPDILCDCCCSWAQQNIGHSTSNVEQTPSSVARLKLDGVIARSCVSLLEAIISLMTSYKKYSILNLY